MESKMNNEQNEIKLNMFDYFLKCLKCYFDFKGRASRKEFWSFVFFDLLITIWLVITLSLFIDRLNLCRTPLEEITTIFAVIIKLPLLIPLLSVSVRRLHDINKSGWYIILPGLCAIVEFIYFFPIDAIKDYYWYIAIFNTSVYAFYLIFFFAKKSQDTEAGNQENKIGAYNETK